MKGKDERWTQGAAESPDSLFYFRIAVTVLKPFS